MAMKDMAQNTLQGVWSVFCSLLQKKIWSLPIQQRQHNTTICFDDKHIRKSRSLCLPQKLCCGIQSAPVAYVSWQQDPFKRLFKVQIMRKLIVLSSVRDMSTTILKIVSIQRQCASV